MKIALALITASVAFSALSQSTAPAPPPTAPAPTSPGQPNTSPGRPNLSPGAPNTSPFQQSRTTPFTPPSQMGVTTNINQIRGFTNFSLLTNSQFFLTNGGSRVEQVGTLLTDLQLALDQALPLLQLLSAEVIVSGDGQPGGPGTTTTRAANGGVNLGRDLSVNLGVNAGQNAAVPTTPARTPPLVATGRTNVFGPAASRSATNFFSTTPETYQLLTLLQNDLARARETLVLLNGADAGGGMSFSNRFFLFTNSFRTR